MAKNILFIGIDVSKGYADFCCLNSQKQRTEDNFQLDDQSDGHERLKEKLLCFSKTNQRIIVGVENTGGYERNWVNAIKKLSKSQPKITIFKVNPKAVKHQIQSLMMRVVDDSVSAYGIALYVLNNHQIHEQDWEKSMNSTSEKTSEQLLHSMIMGLIKQRSAKYNQLEKLIYSAFPELLVFIKNSWPNWFLKLLEKYPTSQKVRQAKVSGLTKIKYLTHTRAEELKAMANNSVGCLSNAIVETIISQHSKDILYLNQEIDRLQSLLVNVYEETPDLNIITSIKGIGDWTGVAFLIEIGDYKRFSGTDQLAAFFGVHPSFKQSGDGKFKVKMSKQGSPKMRAILFNMANNLIKHNPYFQRLYAKYMATGKKRNSVKGILMHKILRIIWGMLMSQTEFNENTDIKNQAKNKQLNETPIELINMKSRRYQEITLKAPVSRTNLKKRKAILEPQSSTLDEKNEVCENSLVQT